MYEVNHENPVPTLNRLHKELFGEMDMSFKVMKNYAGAESEVYYVSKTTVPCKRGDGE